MSISHPNLRSGGKILVDALCLHGVDKIFCVPGESYLDALDALHDVQSQIELVVCRQEGGAAFMAESYGKLTGKPGICFVTRGPGATNASIGVHTAYQDSTPMILFIGQASTAVLGREAFQEIDFKQFFSPISKWAEQVYDAKRLPEIISRAFNTAISGRPGPVVISLPEDILTSLVETKDTAPYQFISPAPSLADIQTFQQLLEDSQRPFILLGGSTWSEMAAEQIHHFCYKYDLPVGTSFRHQHLFQHHHSCYAGDVGIGINPNLQKRVQDSDLIVVVGDRLGEMTTSDYTLLNPPVSKQKLIHIYPTADEINRVYQANLGIVSTASNFVQSISGLVIKKKKHWPDLCKQAHQDYLAYSDPNVTNPGPVQLAKIISSLRKNLPSHAIITNGAGNYAGWIHRFFRFSKYRSQLAPNNGAMGYGLPSAIAAKILNPSTPVISVNGDGCFLMNGQELATAVRYNLPIIILIINNNMYGTIRMHQEREYPGRVIGTDLYNPNFVALAKAYGADGYLVTQTDQFEGIFKESLNNTKPTIIEIKIDPEAINTRTSLSAIRESAITNKKKHH